ncbi:MAG: metal ABC transporter substrate-binding protein [Zhongshania sp.]|uniref:metal ABC transporter substrate-binding protein n=1 Tax=Zhongshania sp. TaxID=1971902 RepID=UPI002612877C|nr:metal ABC transporter substrate-binding protein [Zhongshania sp.]MDF1692520.1 metal ABC transporter substrate-binding protein [Zhongshania sp.]
MKAIILGLVVAWMLGNTAWAGDKPVILTSIMPLQLLVRDIAGDAVTVDLLAPANVSPHDFQLRPSDMQRLRSADLVLWVGPAMEGYLEKAVAGQDNAVALFPALSLDEDPHVWMDGEQVQNISRRIARLLSDRMPTRGAFFHANAARFSTEFRQYDKQLQLEISRVGNRPYLLLHDGFSRFERHFGLAEAEVVMPASDRLPGARHIVRLRARLQAAEFACVFREPQYPAAMLNALTSGLDVPVIEIDPLGVGMMKADGFLSLYRQLGQAFLKCFAA